MDLKKFSLLLIATTVAGSSLLAMEKEPQKKQGTVKRIDFFENIIGKLPQDPNLKNATAEELFRATYGWSQGTLTNFLSLGKPGQVWLVSPWQTPWQVLNDKMPPKVLAWALEHPRRAAIFQGKVTVQSLADINAAIGAVTPLTANPHFTIIFHNPTNPELTDIRFLVEQPENKNAGFQVASTPFGLLEGGMADWHALLTNMLKGAAQGEEINLSTLPSAIWRKYFSGQNLWQKGQGANWYLFKYLADKAPLVGHNGQPLKVGKQPVIDVNKLKAYTFAPGDIEKVAVGLHEGVVVAFGRAVDPIKKPAPEDEQRILNIVVDPQTGKIDTTKTQIINLLFTSAYNLRGLSAADAANPHVIDFAKMILKASYEATIKQLYLAKQPKVYLTLMGASAYANKMCWLAEAINRSEVKDFIKKAGMDVSLIYRPEASKPHRNAQEDIDFIKAMLMVADQVNGTNYASAQMIQRLISTYVKDLYTQPLDNATKAEINAIATQLNGYSSGKAKLAPIKLPFTKFLSLQDGTNIGWLKIDKYNDSVLVNAGKTTELFLDPLTDTLINAFFINPDVPGSSLPAGLYYWQSQGVLGEQDIGKHQRKTAVKHMPKGKNSFSWSSQEKAYVNTKTNKRWDAGSHKSYEF